MLKRVASGFSARSIDVLWVALLFGLSTCISWQGWKAVDVGDDNIPLIESATDLLKAGTIPSRGVISSYGSVTPPGTVWLYLPGVLAFSDYRLFELCGSLLLHAGTLIGLFILAQLAFSRAAARIAVLLYALSPIGLFFASTLWPRGHSFFTVWFVIWIVFWHRRKDSKYLAAALVTFAAGMYVFMEIAPLILVVAAVYCLYRPPLRTKWIFMAAAVSLVIWFPYLRFEQTRDFRDIASLAFQFDIRPPDSARLLCDPSLREAALERQAPAASPQSGIVTRARRLMRSRPHAALIGLLGNFSIHQLAWDLDVGWEAFGRRPLLVAIWAPLFAIVAAVVVLRGGYCPWSRSRPGLAWNSMPTDTEKLTILALVLPWAALLLVAEPLARRYFFLWPLQMALLAYAVTGVPAGLKARVPVLRAAQIALVAMVIVNPSVFEKLKDWRTNGWAGADSARICPLGFLAGQVRSQGRNHAAIGYSIQGSATSESDVFHAIDTRYKIGFDMDYILEQRFGVRNTDRCPEGISAIDDYLIAQPDPDPDPPEYVKLRRRILSEFQQIGQFGEYVVLARMQHRSAP